jgi:hypothetical protein
MELAKIMLPQERRIDICKGQVSALFVSSQSQPSYHLSYLVDIPFLAQELRLVLQDVYPGEHRSIRLDPCDHHHCIRLCFRW